MLKKPAKKKSFDPPPGGCEECGVLVVPGTSLCPRHQVMRDYKEQQKVAAEEKKRQVAIAEIERVKRSFRA